MQPDDVLAPENGGTAERRESIWSVNERWRWLYFTFFLLLMSGSSALVVWHETFGAGAGGGVVQWAVDVVAGWASAAVASAGLSLCITEVVMLSTLLSRKLDERKMRLINEGRREGREEGREEGHEEGRQEGHEEGWREGREEGRLEGRNEGRLEGREEGRIKERAEWDAWLERMMAAQAKGEPFTEPPPSRRADDANGKA